MIIFCTTMAYTIRNLLITYVSSLECLDVVKMILFHKRKEKIQQITIFEIVFLEINKFYKIVLTLDLDLHNKK